jgi:NAD(P)-dependent dehydrogenase (short-subunit alcohol dehydrogenase family)
MDDGPYLITGAAGGIGAACVTALRDAGLTVMGADVDRRDCDIELDVTDPTAVDATISQIVTDHGRLGGVVTAAGVGVGGPMERLDERMWRRAIDTNLWGTIHVVRSAYPHLIAARRGHMVLLGSLSGLVPTPLLLPYATSKWAVVGLARSLAPEARRHGVGITAVCPGPVATAMLDARSASVEVTTGFDPNRYLTDAAGPPLAPATVARAVVRAIGSRKVVVTPGRARVLGRLGAIAPRTTARFITRAMERELAQG